MRALKLSLVCVALAACEVVPTNPFDPATDPVAQARGSISGRIRAVLARTPDGEPAAAGPCALDDLPEADASGFQVVLRGARDGDLVTAALDTATEAPGTFVFTSITPGTYTLEVTHPDFATPPIIEVTLGVGQDRILDDLCAIKSVGPPAPALAPMPDLLRSSDGPVEIVVADADAACNPAAGCAVLWEVTQQRDGAAARVDRVTAEAPSVPLILTDVEATAARATIRVEVVAIDALGNRSAPASDVVIVDDVAPSAPTLASPVVGRDRLTLTWTPAAPVDGDDAAASFFVFYGLLPRADDDVTAAVRDACLFGRPRVGPGGELVDDNGRARFALEGQSPIATSTTSQTLSGISSGTDVVVHVAALDAAGNAGCYSPPLIARPDEVVFAPVAGRAGSDVGGVVRAAQVDGLVDGSLALARGSAGLVVVDVNGTSHADTTPTVDVVADGRQFVTAAGALGVRIIPIDALGAPVSSRIRTVDVGGDVVAVALRPGIAVAAARTGIAVVDLEVGSTSALVNPGARSTIVDVATYDAFVVIARANGLQVVDRAAPHTERAFVELATAPLDLLIHDDAAVVALGSVGVASFDLAGCVDGSSCLASRGRRALPRVGSARNLAAFDEGIVVGVVEQGDVAALLVLDPRAALGIIGRTTTTTVGPLLEDSGLLCVGGGDAATTCVTPLVGPLVEAERRLTTVGDVKRSRASSGAAVAFEEAGVAGEVGFVVRAPLATMTASHRQRIPGRSGDLRQIDPLGGVVLDDGRVVVVDGTARVFVTGAASNDAASLVVDLGPELVAALPDLGDPADQDTGTFGGFVERLGSDLMIVLVAATGDAGVLRVTLLDGAVGLDVRAVDALALPAFTQATNLVLRRGRAFVPTIPFGLLAIDLDTFALAADTIDISETGNTDDVAFVALDGVTATGLLIGTRSDGAAGLFGLDQVGVGAPDDVGLGNALVGLHRFAVVSSNQRGATTLLADVPGGDLVLVPVLELSAASQVQDSRPTVRGLISTDSAGGVVRTVLR